MTKSGSSKKTLVLFVLAGLMLVGCSDKQAEVEPAAAAAAVETAAETVTVPGVVGLTLDKATEQRKRSGSRSRPWTQLTASRS